MRDLSAFRKGQDLYAALCRAIKENEFQLVYQPILNLRTGRFVGAESLLRWMHDGDLIAASDFIEALERTDLLDTVADWAIREACRKAACIHQTIQSDFRIAVNVAPQQWEREHLEHSVRDALFETGCDPGLLDLEITERTCLSNCDRVQTTIRRFRNEGIAVTIDDFGTGHANFTCLRQFPVTHLKIDRYYCRHRKTRNKVLKPIIAAAAHAGLTCTVEGVETEAQLNAILGSGCDEAQGFFIARPTDFDSLVRSLLEQNSWESWRDSCAS